MKLPLPGDVDRSQPSCCLSRLQAERCKRGPRPSRHVTHLAVTLVNWLGSVLENLCVMQSQAGHPEVHLPRECFMLTEFRWYQPSSQGLRRLSREPQSLGASGRNVHGCGGAMSDLRKVGRTGCWPGHTLPRPRYPPDYPQQEEAGKPRGLAPATWLWA